MLLGGAGEGAELGGRHGQRAPPQQGIFQPHHAAPQERTIEHVHGGNARDLVNGAQLQVILQIGADAGQVSRHRDAQVAQTDAIADAGAFENGGAGDGARGEDHLTPRTDGHLLAIAAQDDTDGTAVFDQHAFDEAFGHDRQIGPVEGGGEKAARRAPAAAAPLVDVEIAAAFIAAGVEIGAGGNAGAGRGFDEGIEHLPAQARLLDAPLAPCPMQRAGAAPIVLVLLEEGQHIVPAPAFQAGIAPAVIVGGLATHIDHGVDGRAAAQHLAARIGELAPVEAGGAPGAEHPVGAGIADGKEIAHRNVEPDPVVAPARLQQRHAVTGVFREPVGQYAAGRAATANDVVEFLLGHGALLLPQPTVRKSR